jgi:hypothetical protein
MRRGASYGLISDSDVIHWPRSASSVPAALSAVFILLLRAHP